MSKLFSWKLFLVVCESPVTTFFFSFCSLLLLSHVLCPYFTLHCELSITANDWMNPGYLWPNRCGHMTHQQQNTHSHVCAWVSHSSNTPRQYTVHEPACVAHSNLQPVTSAHGVAHIFCFVRCNFTNSNPPCKMYMLGIHVVCGYSDMRKHHTPTSYTHNIYTTL